MLHLDEGTIHAWIDGALPSDEAARVEAHAGSCAQCAALVAEARGLVAASSRIVSALDTVPGGVIPAFGAPRTRRPRQMRWISSAIAATLVIAAGTMVSLNHRGGQPTKVMKTTDSVQPIIPKSSGAVVTAPPPAVQPIATAPALRRQANTLASRTPAPAADSARINADVLASSATPQVASAKIDVPAPAAPTAPVIERREARVAEVTGSAMAKGAVAATPPSAIGGFAGGTARAPRAAAATQRQLAVSDVAVSASLAGCYEIDQSTDVLPRRFALVAPGEARYVDSAGVMDGKIPDVSWTESSGRAVIRTLARGEVLSIERGPVLLSAQSALGARTVRTVRCR
jgi:anti-sigma factor RsiW